ncbi:hypothetical protein TRVA0_020S00518 [Trichomonascus vanleenenianus]|uniref:Gid11p n=1 Tax=Trichomonascus vanleenenianus TaxID=2268995 RepID=UPI003ECB1649
MTIEAQSVESIVLPKHRCYKARITIKHWQLRDLLCATSSHELVYPSDHSIKALDLASAETSEIATLDFEPRCIQATSHLVACGGVQESTRSSASGQQKGLFSVHSRATNITTSGQLGDYINNAVTMYSDPSPSSEDTGASQYKAIVCNNDHSLYFVDISNSAFDVTDTIKLTSPLNHACISPDRKTIIACGDCAQVVVIHRDESSRSGWSLDKTFNSGSDLGFSAAFHPSGTMFGVAFQDGTARLYDVRNVGKPLTNIMSSRPSETMGAFRCMRFSTGPEDLLFLSEHVHRAHIIDLRNFENHQVLTIPPSFGQSSRTILPDTPLETIDENDTSPIVESFEQIRQRTNLGPSVDTSTGSNIYNRQYHNSNTMLESQTMSPIRRIGFMRLTSPFSAGSSSSTSYNDYGISGLAWSDFEGGSLAVGTDSGIGVWRIDGWSRRTFPHYSIR